MDENAQRIEQRIDRLEEKVDRVDDTLTRAEYWRIGNGTSSNSADFRLSWLMNNAVTRQNMHTVVRDVVQEILKEEQKDRRMDWNKWVNTGMMTLMLIGLAWTIFGGG